MILSNGTIALDLPDDLIWKDRIEWSTVAARDERGITGKILRQTSTKIAGRPITLESATTDIGLVRYATIATLRDWTDEPNLDMTLTLAGVDYAVRFRYDGAPLKASPALGFTRYDADEWWTLTLNLITTE
jgi:hypothetical protein